CIEKRPCLRGGRLFHDRALTVNPGLARTLSLFVRHNGAASGLPAGGQRHNRAPTPGKSQERRGMNGLLTLLGIESWKPVLAALVMPPLPFFLLILIGAR